MIKIGITGQAGFLGSHLYNYLGIKKDEVERIYFQDDYFQNEEKLKTFVKSCDVIVHLAAMNRHADHNVIYNTNIDLVKKLITALEYTNSCPHIIFSSSTQEEKDNLYGKSKREGREMLAEWAKKHNTSFTGLIIPNIFGPFCNPYYNSVIATFCHQLTHDEIPKIDIDGQIKFIYVSEVVEHIYKEIKSKSSCKKALPIVSSHNVPYTSENKVSQILSYLNNFKIQYFDKGIIPQLNNSFEVNLFNTFRSYIDLKKYFPFMLHQNTDTRGSFVEIIKLQTGGQVSCSTTKHGITRGNHFHIRKIERFAVIKGEALIQLRRIGTDEIFNFTLSGDNPSYVDMPLWFVHNITNIGKEELYTIFWINEFFNSDDADTYFE
ncbi:MAG: SDR family oxidoreductase, partial [Bacteroidetes bacterium]|nr:SDR family oxidoreductase [Bacteroidota bacterium]